MQVIKIRKLKYKGKVYNLEVEEYNSYICNGVIVHNCETPVNQLAKFSVLWDPKQVSI